MSSRRPTTADVLRSRSLFGREDLGNEQQIWRRRSSTNMSNNSGGRSLELSMRYCCLSECCRAWWRELWVMSTKSDTLRILFCVYLYMCYILLHVLNYFNARDAIGQLHFT